MNDMPDRTRSAERRQRVTPLSSGSDEDVVAPSGRRISWRTIVLAMSVAVFAASSCDGGEKPELSIDEVVERSRRCLQPVMDAAESLRPQQMALNDCFAKAMADEGDGATFSAQVTRPGPLGPRCRKGCG